MTNMPRKGYKSITVTENVYDWLMNEYKQKKKQLEIRKGIKSFSAYVTHRLFELIEQDKKRNQ